MTYDTFHSYTFDAEGNITAVDGGQTAQYVYNAQNQRVSATVGSTITEYVFSAAGQRVSEWNGATHTQLKGKYYWGAMPVAYYAGGAAHFEHQDWLGTERMRTTYNGGVEGSYISQPWGDGLGTSGTDTDANHYAQLDHDAETATDHAQFRQYSSAQGRWLAPDPYSGSYSMRNPQSFNRYAYGSNNPLAATDPSGMDDDCGLVCPTPYPTMVGTGGAAGASDPVYVGDSYQNGLYTDQNGQYYNVSNGWATQTQTLFDQQGNAYVPNQNGGLIYLNGFNANISSNGTFVYGSPPLRTLTHPG